MATFTFSDIFQWFFLKKNEIYKNDRKCLKSAKNITRGVYKEPKMYNPLDDHFAPILLHKLQIMHSDMFQQLLTSCMPDITLCQSAALTKWYWSLQYLIPYSILYHVYKVQSSVSLTWYYKYVCSNYWSYNRNTRPFKYQTTRLTDIASIHPSDYQIKPPHGVMFLFLIWDGQYSS